MPGEVAKLVRIHRAEHGADRLPVVGERRMGEVAAALGAEDALALARDYNAPSILVDAAAEPLISP